MKNLRYFPAILTVICVFAACSIHVPWEVLDDYDGVRVIMRVTPDDADVLLNGRFIGAAYEYAASGLALRVASRENELAFKKKGYREKVVDLRTYSSSRITLKIELAPVSSPAPGAPGAPAAEETGDEQAYEAQSEPLKPQPDETPLPVAARFLTQVELKVTPEEAAVYIDDRFWGLAPAAGQAIFLRLPPGKYAVAVFKPGYASVTREIVVPKQEKFALQIVLKK
jgi:hypothetical protein